MTTYIKGTFPVRFRRDGKDGVGINSVNTYYALGDSLTVSPSDSKYIYDTLTDVVISTNSGSYVWSGDKIMYTNGNASLTGKYCIGKCSELASVTEQYGTSSSATTAPTSWSDSYPTSLSSGIYIWTRDKIVWKNNDMTYSTAKKVGYISKDGELGFGFVASVERNGNFSEAEWNDTYGKPGHNETWVNTSSIRNGCRVGDIFQVIGYASDTLNMHTAYYRSTTASDNLTGTCISHSVATRGQQGLPGADAYSYRLTSQISSIPLNNDGTPSITSFWLQAYIYKGSTSQTVTNSYNLRYEIWRAGQTSCSSYGQGGTNGKLSVSVNSSYTDIVKISCYFKDSSETVLDSFDILPIKAGAAGVSYFPNNRGYWVINSTYSWSTENMSRDMVVCDIDGTPYLFAVKTAGKSFKSTVSPDKDTNNWEKSSSPYSMLFANFVYTDNASVAGFIWSKEQMRSQSKDSDGNPNLLLDGKLGALIATNCYIKGIIKATGGIFSGEIIAKSGTLDNCTINDTCKITKIEATSGTIGGFDINGASIGKSDGMSAQKGMSLFSDFICFNDNNANGTYQRQAILGTTSYLGSKFLMRLIDNASSYDDHTGIVFDIQNSLWNKNHAFLGNGDGVLNGVIQGYKLNVITSGQIDISNGNTVYCNGNGTNLILPTRENCSNVLGTTGAFALDLTIIGASGASNFKVYGKSDDNNTDCYLLDNNHANNWHATMSQGDVLQLKLIYTGNYFYAYIVSFKQ